MTIIRLFAAVSVLSIFAGTLVVAKRFVSDDQSGEEPTNKLEALIPKKASSVKKVSELVDKLVVENIPDVTLGERAFEGARELLKNGDYAAAEEKLKYVNTYYPTAPSAGEARRILGEMNIDRLLTHKHGAKRVNYTVKSGDSFLKIARNHQTNLDLLMMVNGLQRMDKLHPGDKFSLIPLHFRIVVDLRQKLVSLWDGPRYIKSYEIQQSTLPQKSSMAKTSIMMIEARSDQGSRVRFPGKAYRDARKIIVLKNPKIEITSKMNSVEDGFVGVILKSTDVEELVLLLRAGNSVEIQY